MNSDVLDALKRKGYARNEDGSWSLAAPLVAKIHSTRAEPKPIQALVESESTKIDGMAKPYVRITRFSTGRLDRDNLWASVKSLVDGLQQSGLIHGDSENEIDLQVAQEHVKTRAEQGTEIVITFPPKK